MYICKYVFCTGVLCTFVCKYYFYIQVFRKNFRWILLLNCELRLQASKKHHCRRAELWFRIRTWGKKRRIYKVEVPSSNCWVAVALCRNIYRVHRQNLTYFLEIAVSDWGFVIQIRLSGSWHGKRRHPKPYSIVCYI